MSFLGGDKGSEKVELNPKYVGKLIETRLYAINEKKHYDGVVLTFYCPRCGHNNTLVKPLLLHNLTMDSFMQAVSSYRFETHACVCGTRLTSNNLIIAQYSHFFPETQLDFQAEVTAGSEFVSFYRMDISGDRELIRQTPDFKYMYDTFGRVLSIKECWKHMLSSALQTRSIKLYNVEKGYTIIAIPVDSPRARVNMREIAGPVWPGESGQVIRFTDMAREEGLKLEDTFQDWMPDYAGEINAGHIDAAAIIDLARVLALIKKMLTRDAVEFTVQGDTVTIASKPFKAVLSVKDLAREAVYTGKSFHDVIDAKIEAALTRIHQAESVLKDIRKDMPTYQYHVDGDFLEITNPYNGLSERINIYAPLPKGGTKIIISRLREALCKNERFHPVCKCGRDCFVYKSIEPASWFKTTPNSFNYVFDERENAAILYYISCTEHTNPVMRTDLASWLVERDALDDLFEEELDVLRLNIEAHAGKFGDDIIVGVLSKHACDIMTHPAFIKALLDELKARLGDRVIAYAPYKEMVLIYKEDAKVENLNSALFEIQSIADGKDLSLTPLDYIELFELTHGHGIINLINLPPKPEQTAQSLISEPVSGMQKTPGDAGGNS
ncbi:hypothetical protein [Methanocella sp. MCL-LM]|uniref:hypothetical protein n=1 Tax=Methanocella sp. MCL-LM TaxID=3412035 RepID=UPI003C760B2E